MKITVAFGRAWRNQTHACPLIPVQLTSCPRRYPENQRQSAEECRNTINTAGGGEIEWKRRDRVKGKRMEKESQAEARREYA